MNTRASLTIAIPAFLILFGGCIIPLNIPGADGGAGGAGGDGASKASSSSSSSSSGQGGAGGQAGAGGGGSGGGCVSNGGTHIVDDCKLLALNDVGNKCGPMGTDPPLGFGTCQVGASIFQSGSFDVLYNCLDGIKADAVNACDDAQVSKCVGVMYKSTCASQDSATTCELIATKLCNMGEVFDTQGCLLDTNPLNQTALQTLVNCITDTMPPTTCQADYDACFGKTISIP
jgi:hypothetical protein